MACGNCVSGEVCNHIDGICPSGCEPGWVIGLCSEGKSRYFMIILFAQLSKICECKGVILSFYINLNILEC